MRMINLKTTLEESNITMYQLSKDTGVAYSNIYDVVMGKKKFENMGLRNSAKILKFLYTRKDIIDFLESL